MHQVNYPNRPIYSQFAGNNVYGYDNKTVAASSAFDRYGAYYPQSYGDDTDETAQTAGKAIILQAMTVGLQKLSNFLSNKLAAGEEFTTAQNVVDTANDMVRKNKLDVHVGFIDEYNKVDYARAYGNAAEFDVVAKGQNAFYQDVNKIAVAPKSKPSLILHELGHAINAKGTFTKLLQQSRRYATYAPAVLLVANKLTKNPNNHEKSFIEKHAALLGFCAFLPTIIEEGLASFRGIKAAKSRLGKIPALNILKKNYAIALGTYILSGIGLGIAAKQTIAE